jgi:hypothetical protein
MSIIMKTNIFIFCFLFFVFSASGAEDLGLTGAWNLYEKGQTTKARETVLQAMEDANRYLSSTEDLEPEGRRKVLNAMMNASGLSLTNERSLLLADRIGDRKEQANFIDRLIGRLEITLLAARKHGALAGMTDSETERYDKKHARILESALQVMPDQDGRDLFEKYRSVFQDLNISYASVRRENLSSDKPAPQPASAESGSIFDIFIYLGILVFALAGFVFAQRLLHG